LDILRHLNVAPLSKAGRVGNERRERRFESVSEIGRAAARTHDLSLLGV
jgi:hypothetical protein